MNYELVQGKNEEKIVRLAKANRQEIPDIIKNKPQLLPGLDIYYKAFWELSTCRSIGMMEGPIWWIAIRDYADEMEFTGIDRIRFFFLIKQMDSEYTSVRAKEVEKKKNG